MRIGFASDIHQLVPGRTLVLAGVKIDAPYGELAHSDGDVVYHALAEAILGALALGDLGDHFPDNDESTLNLDSEIILQKAGDLMSLEGYRVGNIDISIYLEAPKIGQLKEAMRSNIARVLKTDIKNVSIKMCTNEGLDSIGHKLATKADAVVLLEKNSCTI